MVHVLKTHPTYFQATWDDEKNFEVRRNDRDYKVGDELDLREYDPEEESYTGRKITRIRIKYILDNPQYVKEGYVILGME